MKFILAFTAVLGTALASPQFSNTGFRRQQQNSQYNNNQYNNQYNRDYNNNQGFASPAKQVVPIIQYSNDVSPDGSYQYSYQTGDGISANANGVVANFGGRDAENSVVQRVQGSYSYTAPDGQVITVNYVADENGYRAEGAHIPTPPPIPAEIAKSLELIAATQSQAPINVGYRQQTNSFQSQRPNQNRFSG